MAGGEENPVGKYEGRGVVQIVKGTEKVSDINLTVEGNLVVFNEQSHIGIITEVYRVSEGCVTGFQMIHSSGNPERGYSGPNYETVTIDGNRYWDTKFEGVYKWDTMPDKQNTQSSTINNTMCNKITTSDNTRVFYQPIYYKK